MALSMETRAERHGQLANSPMEIPPPGWGDIAWRVYSGVLGDRVMLVAAGVTYYMLLALVPSLAIFVSLYGLFNDRATVEEHIALLVGILPPGGLEILKDQLTRLTAAGQDTLSLTLVISIVVALWSSTAGIKALFDSVNIAYGEAEKRNFFVLNLLALGFTLGAIVAVVVLLGVIIVIPVVLNLFYVGQGVELLIRVASYLLMGLLLYGGIGALYRWGPSREPARWRWLTPGIVFSAAGIGLVSVLFSWYAANFSNYNATYGSLGALVGFLTWMWLSITMLLVGAELDAEIEHQTSRDTTTGQPLPIGQRGAFMADHVADIGPPATLDGGPTQLPTGRRSAAGGSRDGLGQPLLLGLSALLLLAIISRGRSPK